MAAIGRAMADLDFIGEFATRNRLDDPVSADPSGLGAGDAGRVWFNTASAKWKYWNGSAAIDVLLRANHSGTQLWSTISDGAASVQAYRLDQFAAATSPITVADGSTAGHAINKGQLDAALASLTSGQVIKGAVKCATTSNINISSAPASIDGVSMSNGDIALLAVQTTGPQAGPYVFNGAGSAMTRATNWDTSAEAVLGSYWIVEQGTFADNFALLTNDSAITLGTTTPTFAFMGGITISGVAPISVSGGVVSLNIGTGLTTSGSNLVPDFGVVGKKLTGIIPTSTSGIVTISGANVTINHSLNNWAPMVVLVAYSSPYSGYTSGDIIGPTLNGFTASDANNVTGSLPAAPASNNWAYSIIG